MKLRINLDRRSGKDRRNQSSFNVKRLFSAGMREYIRRQQDRQKIFYVDRYSTAHFAAIISILILSAIDASLTLVLMNHGAVEINPVMAYSLHVGPHAFVAVKLILTAIGVFIILMLRNVLLRGFNIYTHSLFYVIIGLFMAVIGWEFFLVYNHFF